MDVFSLEGKVAVVTGAGQGLGKAFALAFARAGADIAVAELNEDTGPETVHEIESAGRRARFIRTDVTESDSVDRMAADAVDAFGRIDVLVNNAGICHWDAAESVSDADWRRVVDVNLNGLFYCCRAVGRTMIERKRGSIVNIASMSGSIVNVPQPQASYNATKAAVVHLTRSLAVEWAPHNVRVNAISPGYMKTAMTRAFLDDPGYGGKWIPAIPMNRPGEPDELTPAAVYLASDASSYTTGAEIVIDGGYTAV